MGCYSNVLPLNAMYCSFLCVRSRPPDTVQSAIGDLIGDTPTNVSSSNDLANLCSGVFNNPSTTTTATVGLTTTGTRPDGTSTDYDILALCSGAFPSTVNTTVHPGFHSNNDCDDSSDDEMPQLKRLHQLKPRAKQTKGCVLCCHSNMYSWCLCCSERLLEFVEGEAELSGSDVGPEESEGEEGEDGYVEEGGSDADLSDSELQHQINKVHM